MQMNETIQERLKNVKTLFEKYNLELTDDELVKWWESFKEQAIEWTEDEDVQDKEESFADTRSFLTIKGESYAVYFTAQVKQAFYKHNKPLEDNMRITNVSCMKMENGKQGEEIIHEDHLNL